MSREILNPKIFYLNATDLKNSKAKINISQTA